jgi:hypothetical protein
MNFMHEIRPCEERFGRQIDGSIDFRRYEMLARRERSQAFTAVFDSLRNAIRRAVPVPHGDLADPPPGFREA